MSTQNANLLAHKPARRVPIKVFQGIRGVSPDGQEYESTLESDYLTLLRFDPEVASYRTQPCKVSFRADGQYRSYTPCDAPAIPYRIEQGRRRSTPTLSGRICHTCGVDLAHGPQVGLSTRDLEVRLAIATLCTYAWFSTSTFRFRHSDATVDIYNDLPKLCHLVYSRRRKLNQLGPAVRALAGSSAAPRESDTFNLEHTRISGRIEALSLALWLLTDWPDRLHIALGCAVLSRLRMRNAYANWSLGMLHTLARPKHKSEAPQILRRLDPHRDLNLLNIRGASVRGLQLVFGGAERTGSTTTLR